MTIDDTSIFWADDDADISFLNLSVQFIVQLCFGLKNIQL